jgi:hypothetical protein
MRQDRHMGQAFAHEASLMIAPDGDDGAAGAAITVALCGHWGTRRVARWRLTTRPPNARGMSFTFGRYSSWKPTGKTRCVTRSWRL